MLFGRNGDFMDMEFYKGKKVFITGHTGFKGSWLCKLLINLGAEVTGYALQPQGGANLFSISRVGKSMTSIIGDVRDKDFLFETFKKANPEIVIHMAAQPIVLESYHNPVYTYETNVMGTVNILECTRLQNNVRSFLNVTTDKVYKNNEWVWGYREIDELDGFDPYSNSKSCSELVTASYKRCFFDNTQTSVSTARAGNVIGGGDFAPDRIIPDCFRAIELGDTLKIRNPYSIRPYQHVLEPLYAYLLIAESQYKNINYGGCYNVGPYEGDCISTEQLINLVRKNWGEGFNYEVESKNKFHEAGFLKLDITKLERTLNWSPIWNISKAVEKTCDWFKVYFENADSVHKIMDTQIDEFLMTKTIQS